MTFPHVNEVRLVGRLSGEPEWRVLPSGDELARWRLVVERAVRSPGERGRVVVDTLGCVTFDADVSAAARVWRHGDLLSVRGALRRRFWRAGDRSVSRYQVEVFTAEPAEVPVRAAASARAADSPAEPEEVVAAPGPAAQR